MKAKVIVLPKRDFSYKLKLVSNGDCLKRFAFFWALALEKTQIRHDLPPRLSRILCSSFLFVDDLFSVCFQERLCISFWRCSSLDICLFIYVFSCSLSRSFHRILPIVVSSQTIFRVFIDSLYFFYFLFFLVPFYWSTFMKLIHDVFNPLHPKISMRVLRILLNAFPDVLARRICLTIKRFFS